MTAKKSKSSKEVDLKYKFKLTNVRLSYAHLRTPYKAGDKLSGKFLVDRNDPVQEEQLLALSALIKQCMKDELQIEKLPSERKCLRKGDDTGVEEHEGYYVVSMSNDRIKIYDRAKNVISSEEAPEHPDEPYSGCYVNVIGTLWAQNHTEYGKRINATPRAVQFAAHGEAFGQGDVDYTDEFDEVETPDDDDFEESDSAASGLDDDDDDL